MTQKLNERINLNKLAKDITLEEGKKESISVAQVKEVLKITLQRLSKYKGSRVLELVEKYEI